MPSERSLPLIKEEACDPSGDGGCLPAKCAAARQLDGTDAEWKYRGRANIEQGEIHPICAPASLSAQKDKGFQRFYKAVVSPTHVRVTAGGRIVPNTRGSSSPTARWSKEKVAGDGVYTGRPASRSQHEQGSFPIPQGSFGVFPPMVHALTPGLSPGMAAGHSPYPMLPWHMGVNMGSGFGFVHPHMSQMPASIPTAKNSATSIRSDKQSEACNSDNSNSVRISPPEQFDQTRPFFYNGQWMMPQGALYPYGMPPVAGFPVPPLTGPQMMHPRFGIHPMLHLQNLRSDQQNHSQAAPGFNLSPLATCQGPPVSSIRPSEITKRQIDVLRNNLKYLEDQLQYNKHQIDERTTENQAQVVRQQIQLFEKNLEAQLTYEESRYPRNDKMDDLNGSASSQEGFEYRSRPGPESKPGHGNQVGTTAVADDSTQSRAKGLKCQEQASSSQALSTGLSKPSASSMPLKSALKKPRPCQFIRKSSAIPVSAALAPPFQPRAESSTSNSATTDSPLLPSVADSGSEIAPKSDGARTSKGNKPYLVGMLPRGSSATAPRGTDYI